MNHLVINIKKYWLEIVFLLAISLAFSIIYEADYLRWTSLEERLLSLQATKNYEMFGFAALSGLAAYNPVTSEPYVYTHLTDFPAWLLYLIGNDEFGITTLRILLMATVPASFLLVYLFAEIKFELVRFLSFAALFTFAPSFVSYVDHLHFPLTLFVYCLGFIFATKVGRVKRIIFWISLNIILASLISWFAAFNLLVFHSLHLYLIRREINLKNCWIVPALSFSVAVGLKITLNATFLGFQTAAIDIIYSISNRSIGVPNFLELMNFFKEHGIVLWGAPPDLELALAEKRGMVEMIVQVLKPLYSHHYLKYTFIYLFLIFSLFLIVSQAPRFFQALKEKKSGAVLLACGIVGIYAFGIVFASHAQGYTDPFGKSFVYAFVVYRVLFHFTPTAIVVCFKAFDLRPDTSDFFRKFIGVFFTGLLCLLISSVWLKPERKEPFVLPEELKKNLEGEVVLTNVSAILVSYFSESSIVIGRCVPEVLDALSYQDYCFNYFYKNSAESFSNRVKTPRYFLFADKLISGNMLMSRRKELVKFKSFLDSHPRLKLDHRYKVAPGIDFWLYEIKRGVAD